MTEGRQAIARVRIRLEDGREAEGFAAEALGAKWFDKNPTLSDAQNLHQLRRALELTVAAYRAAPALTAFDLFAEHYRALQQAGAAHLRQAVDDQLHVNLPPLHHPHPRPFPRRGGREQERVGLCSAGAVDAPSEVEGWGC